MKITVKLITMVLMCLLLLPTSSFAMLNEVAEVDKNEETVESMLENAMECGVEEEQIDNSESGYTFEIECTAPPITIESILEAMELYMAEKTSAETLSIHENKARTIESDREFSGYVYTKGQARVPVYVTASDFTEEECNFLIEAMETSFPEAEILAEPTRVYNCHSYAWYESNRFNPYWIYDVEIYMADIHSELLAETENYMLGDIIVYKDSNGEVLHSAVIVEVTDNQIICESKWGELALVRHEAGYVPATYRTVYGTLNCSVYRFTAHDWKQISYNASGHNFECQICPYSYTEAHKMTALNVCRICMYSGPLVWN